MKDFYLIMTNIWVWCDERWCSLGSVALSLSSCIMRMFSIKVCFMLNLEFKYTGLLQELFYNHEAQRFLFKRMFSCITQICQLMTFEHGVKDKSLGGYNTTLLRNFREKRVLLSVKSYDSHVCTLVKMHACSYKYIGYYSFF